MTPLTTTSELIELLSQHHPDTPVLLPTLLPHEANNDHTPSPNGKGGANGHGHSIPLTTEMRDGITTLLVGDHRQSAAEYPELEGTAVFIHALIRQRAALESLTKTNSVTLPTGPILPFHSPLESHNTLLQITAAPNDPKARQATILQALPARPADDSPQAPLPVPIYLLVLTTETPTADDAAEAADRAHKLHAITAVPTIPIVAAVHPPADWPDPAPVPIHTLDWTERRCPSCERTFRTARGLRVHLMLEAGQAENQPRQQKYWQRYMDDLRQLSEEIPHHFQEHPAYRPTAPLKH